MNKTVYILGAGFSMDAGAPSQEGLVKKMFDIHKKDKYILGEDNMNKFQKFLSEILLLPKKNQINVPLEDVFTPIDRCLLDNISFRNLNVDEVKEIRGLVYYLIGKTLKHILEGPEKAYVDNFAQHLITECSLRKNKEYKKLDKISVISTNWDILLDTSLQRIINHHHHAVVDYCCYISSYRENDDSVKPGLEILGEGGFNVKLLKLHGSLNWLQCPRCQRVYVDMDNKIAIDNYKFPINCRHCDKNFKEQNGHKLSSNIIMPTFLKNLSNPQYKLIWQNAGIELSEATKIVFIGYSLPQADFEMRQLLSRMVRSDAIIEVVDYAKSESEQKYIDTINRFKMFFGSRKLTPFHIGAKEYINQRFSG